MSDTHITANGKDCLSVVANGTEKYRVTTNSKLISVEGRIEYDPGKLIYAKGRIEYDLGSMPSGASWADGYNKYIYVYYGWQFVHIYDDGTYSWGYSPLAMNPVDWGSAKIEAWCLKDGTEINSISDLEQYTSIFDWSSSDDIPTVTLHARWKTGGLADLAAALMEHLCTCSSHGYTQGSGRWGDDSAKCTVDYNGTTYELNSGDRDCSSAVINAWQVALAGTEYGGCLNDATYTGNMSAVFTESGLFSRESTDFDAERGDIYLNEAQHTAMCLGDGQLGEFCINEFNDTIGGEVGDQTGDESHVAAYYSYPWDCILHYTGS